MTFLPILLLCIGFGLIIPSLALMREGLFHFGVTLPVLLGVTFVAVAIRWRSIRNWCTRSAWRGRLWGVGWCAFGVWLITVGAFFFNVSQLTDTAASLAEEPVALIVLGAGSPKCEVSPTLRARLDAAKSAAVRWSGAMLVVSGGKDLLGRSCTEAEVMRTALVAQGLSEDRVLLEGRSTSTAENFEFSKAVLAQAGISMEKRIAIVSSDFHGARALRIGRKAGFDRLEFVPASTPLRYRYHAWLREYFASISSWILREI